MSKLAINGGAPSINFNTTPHYTWPVLTEKTEAAVLHQMKESISIYDKSGIIDRLEKRLATYHDTKYALLTCTGTAGLHSAFIAIDLREGDEVICPAYTFYATVTPLFSLGVIPVLVDAQMDGNIDPDAIEAKINSRTKAIVITHMWGIPCEMDKIVKIAKKHNLFLIEDCSHAHGAIYNGKKVGTFGDISVFSLQGQKTLTGGEGGFLLTSSDDLYHRAVLFGHYNKRCLQEIPSNSPLYQYGITGMGLKLRIHPLAAAIANEQMDHLDEILENRRKIASKMIEAFGNFAGIEPPAVNLLAEPTWYAMVFQFDGEKLNGLSLNRLYEALKAEGCKEFDLPTSTRPLNLLPLFQNPSLLFPKYEGCISYKPGDFPVAESFYKKALKLPVWHDLKDLKILDQYIGAFEKVIKNYRELLS